MLAGQCNSPRVGIVDAMSELIRDSVLVLRVTPFSETSVILTVFSRSHGKLALLVKGARRKVKNGSALAIEPCYELEVVWGHKPSREIQIAHEITLLRSRYSLRNSLELLVVAHTIAELLLRCLKDEDPHPELYGISQSALSMCESRVSKIMPVLWKFELELLTQIGFTPTEIDIKGEFSSHLSLESVAILRKLRDSSIEMAARLRTSQLAEQEITIWFRNYFTRHLAFPAQLRSLGALNWARVKL